MLYPCFCTRREIQAEITCAGGAPQGEAGPLYPGTCRLLSSNKRQEKIDAGFNYALRLDVAKAIARAGRLEWSEHGLAVKATPQAFGDVVLARKDVPVSYHLAVTVDDALQGVTLVTRGADLLAATHIHRLLQALLGLPTPAYRHHPLLMDAFGRRLAKRDKAATVRDMREVGFQPDEVIRQARPSA